MMLIIVHHLFVHCIGGLFAEMNAAAPAELLNNQLFFGKMVIMDYAYAFGKIGNVIFILISGYYLAGKESVNLGGQIKKILSQLLFVVLLLCIGSFLLLFFKNIPLTVTLFTFHDDWWFIGFYIAILVMGALFLNRLTAKLSQMEYSGLVLALFGICALSFSRQVLSGLAVGLEILAAGLFAYLLGGYIRRFQPFAKIKSIAIWGIILLTLILMGISHYGQTYNGIKTAIAEGVDIYKPEFVPYAEYYLPCVILGVLIFELARRAVIKNNAFINYVAAATFMMYLIHSNAFSYKMLFYLNWYELVATHNILMLALYVICLTLGVMLTATFLYFVYSLVFKLFTRKDKQK